MSLPRKISYHLIIQLFSITHEHDQQKYLPHEQQDIALLNRSKQHERSSRECGPEQDVSGFCCGETERPPPADLQQGTKECQQLRGEGGHGG